MTLLDHNKKVIKKTLLARGWSSVQNGPDKIFTKLGQPHYYVLKENTLQKGELNTPEEDAPLQDVPFSKFAAEYARTILSIRL